MVVHAEDALMRILVIQEEMIGTDLVRNHQDDEVDREKDPGTEKERGKQGVALVNVNVTEVVPAIVTGRERRDHVIDAAHDRKKEEPMTRKAVTCRSMANMVVKSQKHITILGQMAKVICDLTTLFHS